jgi:pimeloyl-ACP methyl ester carboxylesterase
MPGDDIIAEADSSAGVASPPRPRQLGGSTRTSRDVDVTESETTPLLDHGEQRPKSRMSLTLHGLKGLLGLFTVASLVWFLLLFVDTFTSFGLVDTRGSGFLQINLSVIALSTVLVSLIFFGVPAKADRIVGYITAGLLLIDCIVLFSVRSLRHRHGTKEGVITAVGAFLVVLVASGSEHASKWGKSDEEIQQASRHTLTEWLELTVSFIVRLIVVIITIFISINIYIEAYDSKLTPPGSLVTVAGDYQVHVFCTEPNPFGLSPPPPVVAHTQNLTILVEAGETSAEDFSSWIMEMYNLNQVGRVCYWDRPGMGFSDSAPTPLSAGMAVDALIQALNDKAGPNQSYLLVSHGVGGIYSRIFASKRPNQVHSLLLVDALHEDLLYRKSSSWQGLKYWVEAVVAPWGLQNIAGWLVGHEGPADRIYGEAMSHQPGYLKARLQEQISARRQTKREIIAANALIPSRMPLAVVSSAESIRKDAEWGDKQRQLTKLTDNSLAWEILDGPHQLWKRDDSKRDLQELLEDLLLYV